jgi:serine protease AprX
MEVRVKRRRSNHTGAIFFLITTIFLFYPTVWAQAEITSLRHDKQSTTENSKMQNHRLSDRDSDGLSDGLQANILNAKPDDRVDVVVTLSGLRNARAALKAVGPFHLKREFKIIPAFSAEMTVAQARALSRNPGVFRVEENFTVHAMIDSANQDFGINRARSEFSSTGSGVGICVIDTGVDPGHEQLDEGKVVDFVDIFSGVEGAINAFDDHGHGTHVSAIAAGDGIGLSPDADKFKGVAPNASIYAAKVLDSAGSGTEDIIIAGIDWCVSRPDVHILSMSLGTSESSDGQDALSQAVSAAANEGGKIVIVAAGNSGADQSSIGSPGAADNAITVGAVAEWSAVSTSTNHSEGIYLAPFSSRGPILRANTEFIKPDIVAPGVTITAAKSGTQGEYVTYSGTSMATPFVAGTVALALQDNLYLNSSEIKNYLTSTAKDCGQADKDNDWGAGLIDGYAFISQAQGLANPGKTAFPKIQRISGTVGDNSYWETDIEVTDTSVPIALTMTIEGDGGCDFWFMGMCLIVNEWTPDLDADLYDPAGKVISTTFCPLGNECGVCGRQETLHAMPTTTGMYRVRVYPYYGTGGNFTIDVSTGPLVTNENDLDFDDDGDGYTDNQGDCNDFDLSIYPNATEICSDGIDQNCDGKDLICPEDIDNDGDTYTENDGDCDDSNSSIYPGAEEICGDLIDQNCNGEDLICDEDYCSECFKGKCDGVCHPKEAGTNCPDCTTSGICGDGVCNGDENSDNCSIDCGEPPSCGQRKEPCSSNDDCCSGRCFRGVCK